MTASWTADSLRLNFKEESLGAEYETQDIPQDLLEKLVEKFPFGYGDEDIIRFISAKKEEPEWLLEYRLKAYIFLKYKFIMPRY